MQIKQLNYYTFELEVHDESGIEKRLHKQYNKEEEGIEGKIGTSRSPPQVGAGPGCLHSYMNGLCQFLVHMVLDMGDLHQEC